MAEFIEGGKRYSLRDPKLAPQAGAFLWNRRMMVQVTCRGFAVGQFMQPEPSKYAHVPTLAGTSFMQPEQPYFAHHPGRFFYVRDDETGEIFSAPYEPVKVELDSYEFSPGQADIRWVVEKLGIELRIRFTLTAEEIVEIWSVELFNKSGRSRKISLYPYFPVGYSSWMNLGGTYDEDLQGLVCSCVKPYQKVADYFKQRDFKDLTYLLSDVAPDAWEAKQAAFEGDGGLNNPDALKKEILSGGDAIYEIPVCSMQYRFDLEEGGSRSVNLLFGPAKDKKEIESLKDALFAEGGIEQASRGYAEYVAQGTGSVTVDTPDSQFNGFVNNWLERQVFYHGDSNRLTTDPQTRNYLQDAMGMAFVDPSKTKLALETALAQQKVSGEMPDGIIIVEGAELKYINQVPHTDHPVWLALCLDAYLNETADWSFLDQEIGYDDSEEKSTVFEHLDRGMKWLCQARDERGLSYIAQGDWCDPMNMVGYKGKGVSGWLTEAVSYALQLWIPISRERGREDLAENYEALIDELNQAINEHLWDGDWYGRGITDDGIIFGISDDKEGRIFLNTQSWAYLCGAPNEEQKRKMAAAIAEQLDTPYGVMMGAPAFTKMRDDVGRVTQKFPGSAENGSIYNHAAAFYAASLYHIGNGDEAYSVLRRMIPGPGHADIEQRGQLPIYIPNYYRGAYHQFPRTAGRSSQLFNTGTVAWFYRMLIEEMFGLKGCKEGLRIAPNLPREWTKASMTREFRGATFEVSIVRRKIGDGPSVKADGVEVEDGVIRTIEKGRFYRVEVQL